MTEYEVSIRRCPKCGYMTNKPVGIKNHEDLKCDVKMDLLTLTYKHYKKFLTLEVEGHLKLDVFI